MKKAECTLEGVICSYINATPVKSNGFLATGGENEFALKIKNSPYQLY